MFERLPTPEGRETGPESECRRFENLKAEILKAGELCAADGEAAAACAQGGGNTKKDKVDAIGSRLKLLAIRKPELARAHRENASFWSFGYKTRDIHEMFRKNSKNVSPVS